ncbi:EcoRII N-terminal effector-binding domain-containing protein [Ramlibacter albus]|uniref:Restriction endonuclease type II EcoRII N-terminal domain-containing protein n=1 Tax=Ramlibacter albus TaxID=2079448 RepID=A0A923S1J9_9BURK|nr:EcoRII N-terminal effector-binding domain-containing protein [Ramlibacter albus]MBC5763763.1 hypothetical protein [Ramlibacter albus]
MSSQVVKRLSANDVGDTGGHQAGILVPLDPEILAFFPKLNTAEKNPRCLITVREGASNERWDFAFIYYNNKKFGGTRNEYRLTRMTKFLRAVNAKEGDELRFWHDEQRNYRVELRRTEKLRVAEDVPEFGSAVLVLSGGWKVIKY